MYIYKINEDGATCNVRAHREGALPEGFAEVFGNVSPHRLLYFVEGALTNDKPQALIDSERKAALENLMIVKDQEIQSADRLGLMAKKAALEAELSALQAEYNSL